jgi:phosphate transport system protein
MDSLRYKDIELAREVVQEEQKIDQKEFDIRYSCMEVIEKGLLGRKNLYRIIATLGVITELERIGDYAEGIAKISLMFGDEPALKLPKNIVEMTDKGLSMLRESVQSFIESDVDEAQHICQMDNEIDTLYSDTFCELILMMVQESSTITRATRLVWVAHNLERLADRVTNICEWTPYSVTGEKRHIGSSSY